MAEDALRSFCESRIGSVLVGKWTLERLIGIGGMAAVYQGLHKIGRREAIKILHPEVAKNEEFVKRFEREAEAANRFNHPGIVEIRDVDVTDDGCPFLVMELLSGENLGERARRLGGIDEPLLLRIFEEALDALAAVHALGIIHRDVKLDNLFVTDDMSVKLLDFGIARMDGGPALTRVGMRIGTVAYSSPEQVRGQPVDGRSDVFSVGATMFRLLARKRIHEGANEGEIALKMGSKPAPKLCAVAPGIDPLLAMVVDRALEFNVEDRYPDAATMRDDLRALRAGLEPPFAIGRFRKVAVGAGDATLVAPPVSPTAATQLLLTEPPPAAAGGPPSAPASSGPVEANAEARAPVSGKGKTEVMKVTPAAVAPRAPIGAKASPVSKGSPARPSSEVPDSKSASPLKNAASSGAASPPVVQDVEPPTPPKRSKVLPVAASAVAVGAVIGWLIMRLLS